jgi:hypothetical protein
MVATASVSSTSSFSSNGHVAVAEPGHRLGPGERGALSLGVDGRLAEHGEQIDALRALAGGVEILAVHVDAEGAAVDLRDAQVHEVEEPAVEAGRLQVALDAEERAVRVRGDVLVAEALRHGSLPRRHVAPGPRAHKPSSGCDMGGPGRTRGDAGDVSGTPAPQASILRLVE